MTLLAVIKKKHIAPGTERQNAIPIMMSDKT